jgi:hypothetical protein
VKPDAALGRCAKCQSWIVTFRGKVLCRCVIGRVHPDHRDRLQRLFALLCEDRVCCDRCLTNTAFRIVQCYEGCYHAQCWGCADQTKAERAEELAYRSPA